LLLENVLVNAYYATAEVPIFHQFLEKSHCHRIHSLENKNWSKTLTLVN